MANLFPVCMAHALAPLNAGISGLRLVVMELPVAATKFLFRHGMLAIIVAGYQGAR